MEDTHRHFTATVGFWSFIALASGLLLGIWGFESGSPWISALARVVQPLGVIWLNALRMAVLPMVVISVTTLGVPVGGSRLKSLPAYVGAGVPEAIVQRRGHV